VVGNRTMTVEWVSVEERLPEVESIVWVFNARYGGEPVDAVTWGYVDEDSGWYYDDFPIHVTHWAEIIRPSPPEK